MVGVLGTGGTIAGRAARADDHVGYQAGALGVEQLLAGLAPPGLELQTEQVANIDSKDMTPAVWRALAARCLHWLERPEVAGLVIPHGTDTLEESAYFLHRVLPADKPVVLVGAMRPASALSPDGPQNLRDAIGVAASPQARGVMAVCAGVIFDAVDLQKLRSYRLDAFGAGDAGPLGFVEPKGPRWVRNLPPAPEKRPLVAIKKILDGADWPRVELVFSHAGAGPAVVDALRAARAVDGLVIAATGNGTVHQALEAAALRAQAEGVAVWRASRCAFGHIVPGAPQALPDAGGLSPVKARIALMLALLEG